MARFISSILFAIILFPVFSQNTDTSSDSDLNKMIHKVGDYMNPYGSYRINFGINDAGYVGMADNASRFGITGALPLIKNLDAIAGIELGARLVDYDETIIFRGDPGYQVGEGNSNLFGRLGYVGIQNKFFSFTIGKQWSAYYDVAAYTDGLFAFGGEASGAFNNGTDGGISGTGRANQLFLLRTNYKNFYLALQMQARSITENSVKIGDTYGGSIQYKSSFGLSAGFAMVIVEDGIDHPRPNQPKSGDKSYVGSLAYEKNNFHIALSYTQFYQHELESITDSTSLYYDGYGSEIFSSYTFGSDKKWRAAILMNILWPAENLLIKDYRMLYFVGEYSYSFGKDSKIFLSVKQDFPRDIFGNSTAETIFAMGFRFSFGY